MQAATELSRTGDQTLTVPHKAAHIAARGHPLVWKSTHSGSLQPMHNQATLQSWLSNNVQQEDMHDVKQAIYAEYMKKDFQSVIVAVHMVYSSSKIFLAWKNKIFRSVVGCMIS